MSSIDALHLNSCFCCLSITTSKYFEDACNLRILIEAVIYMYNDVTFYTVVYIVLPIHSEVNHRLEVHIKISLLPSQEISKNGMPESFTDEAEAAIPKWIANQI